MLTSRLGWANGLGGFGFSSLRPSARYSASDQTPYRAETHPDPPSESREQCKPDRAGGSCLDGPSGAAESIGRAHQADEQSEHREPEGYEATGKQPVRDPSDGRSVAVDPGPTQW